MSDDTSLRLDEKAPGAIIGADNRPDPEEGTTAQANSLTPPTRYKLEVMYDGSFSVHKPNLGVLCAWLTGGDDLPNADWKVYFCPRDGCDGIVTPSSHGGIITVCPTCRSAWNPKELHGEYLYVTTVDKWAKIISEYLQRFNMDADIYLKRLKTKLSLIEADHQERNHQFGGELLDAARELEAVVYPRDRLIRDIGEGAQLEKTIKAFLLA